MRIVPIQSGASGSPDSPEWHIWRSLGVGGSDAVIIAAGYGLIPRSDVPSWVPPLEQLLLVKRGEKDEEVKSAYAQFYLDRGKASERRVRHSYEEASGMIVSPLFGENDDHPFIRASFDGVSICGKRVAEIKVPGGKATEMARAGMVPPYYRPQLAHQAMVAFGIDPDQWPEDAVIDYVSGFSEEAWENPIIIPVPASSLAPLAKSLFLAERAFWRAVTGDGLLHGPEYVALVAAYDAAEASVKAAEEELAAARQRLMAFYEDYPFGRIEGSGRALDLETRAGSIDYAAVLAAKGIVLSKAEEDRFRKKGSSSFAIRARGRKVGTAPGLQPVPKQAA